MFVGDGCEPLQPESGEGGETCEFTLSVSSAAHRRSLNSGCRSERIVTGCIGNGPHDSTTRSCSPNSGEDFSWSLRTFEPMAAASASPRRIVLIDSRCDPEQHTRSKKRSSSSTSVSFFNKL